VSVQAGIWNLDGEPVSREFLTTISRCLADYGPDGETMSFDGPVGVLYRPLHTTLESRVERQPHFSASGKIITWDGRLDNRNDLISQLWNELADDRTDVAVAAAAFDRWGTDCFVRLVGDWAISIWDRREKELVIARDYIGIRHLFYYPGPKRILWCNHLAPLALCGEQFTISDEYVAGYLAAHPDARLTPYREIHSVPPGRFVHIRIGQVSIHTYWAFTSRPKTRYKTDAEYDEHYRHLFRQAVRRRLRTDSPVLAELSGGLDSSSIVCMADDILGTEGAETPRVDTLSYYDSNEPVEDDLVHLAKVEDKRGKTGLRFDLKGSGDSLPLEHSAFVATPGFGSRAEIKAAMSEIARQHKYRVMLCGTGGDEVNGQALDPHIMMADLLLGLRLVELTKQLTAWSLLSRRPWIQVLLQSLAQLLPLTVRSKLSKQGQLEPWVNRTFARKFRLSARQMTSVESLRSLGPAARDALHTLTSLSRQMTHRPPSTMEQRYPYLDRELVEFLSTIPLNQLLRPGHRRLLMRRALSTILPPEVASRKTKTSAARCYPVALEKHWSEIEGVLASPISGQLGYVDKNAIHTALFAMKNGQVPTHFLRLLKALSLELWLRDVGARRLLPIEPSVPPTTGTRFGELKPQSG
jgi:asparagine synthase (glutamine-hydrolysing)